MGIELDSRLGAYEIVGLLGVGGMGEVYRARDSKLQREVALKVLPDAFASDPERLARFEREAQLLASLNHPNIAVIHGIEESRPVRRDGTSAGAETIRALVLELIDGVTLAEQLDRGALPIDEALGVARQITDALAAAHAHGVIHRDLKPANVKVRSDGMVKVLDFGLAKALDSGATDSSPAATLISPAVTRHGVFLGTAAYMSPEQARGRPADERGDLWAFGCVLFEMLTGARAFGGEDVSESIAAVLRGEPEWQRLPAATPSSIRRLLRRCLEKDPKRRLADARDARLELDDAATEPPAAMPAAARRERIAWTIAALAVVLAVAGAAAWPLRPSAPAGDESAATQLAILPPEDASFVFEDRAFALSPDGRTLAFIAVGADGAQRLWVRPLDSPAARVLPGTEGARAPFWSADGRNLAFFAGGSLKRISAQGGGLQVLAAADSSIPLGGTWSADDVILFSPEIGGSIARTTGRGADPRTVTDVPGLWVMGSPSFLPDGRHFVYTIYNSQSSGSLYWGAIDGPEFIRLTAAESQAFYAPPGYLLYVQAGTLLAQPFDPERGVFTGDAVPIAQPAGGAYVVFTVSRNGTLVYRASSASTQLVWVDRGGRQIGPAGPPGDYGATWALSPDDRRVAFDRVGPSGVDVWILDLERQIASRLTTRPPLNNAPIWSPDGAAVAFTTARDGLDIYRRDATGAGDDEELVKVSGQSIVSPSDWSRDGRMLAYYRTVGASQTDTWIKPLEPGRDAFPFLSSPFDESQGQFSPDGRWFAYVSNPSGEQQVYVTSVPTPSGRVQVSTAGGNQPRWSPDGRELFYLASDGKLMAAAVRPGPPFAADLPRPLFDTALMRGALRQSYAVSADGERFLLQLPIEAPRQEATIVLDWPALLKR